MRMTLPFRYVFNPWQKAWKSLSKYALAGFKSQKNRAERRFGALSRENWVPAGGVDL
jgi:hypothetical protein